MHTGSRPNGVVDDLVVGAINGDTESAAIDVVEAYQIGLVPHVFLCLKDVREGGERERLRGEGEEEEKKERRDTLDVTVLNRDATSVSGIHPSGECVDS